MKRYLIKFWYKVDEFDKRHKIECTVRNYGGSMSTHDIAEYFVHFIFKKYDEVYDYGYKVYELK